MKDNQIEALIWPAIGQPGIDLPDISLATETSDVTLHTSCTLHMAQPPRDRERRVLYAGFALPDRSKRSASERQRIRDARESAPVTVSQEASESKLEELGLEFLKPEAELTDT